MKFKLKPLILKRNLRIGLQMALLKTYLFRYVMEFVVGDAYCFGGVL